METEVSSINLGSFKLEVSTATLNQGVGLSDDDGKTYVITSGGDLVQAAFPNGTGAIATVTLKIKVSYVTPTGATTPSDTELAALWKTTIDDDKVTVTATASGTNAARVKYTASATSYTNVSGKNVVEIANGSINNLSFSSGVTSEVSMPSMYVGVDGGAKTGTVQNDGDAAFDITISFAPANV